MSYNLSKEEFIKILPSEIKKDFLFIKTLPDPIFAEDSFKPNKNKIYGIKTSKNNIDIISKKFKLDKKNQNYDLILKGYKIRFIESGKSTKRKGDANTTRQQELCSLKILENVYKNKPFNLNELCSIYPDLVDDQSWQDSFKAQEKIFQKIKQKYKIKADIFNRDGGFMDFITKKVRDFGVRQKDSWNPADIWIYSKNIEQYFKDVKSLPELNKIMLELLKNKKLLGISLKKTGKTAKLEEVNISKTKYLNNKFIKGNLLLSLNKNKFTNDELNFDMQYYDESAMINTQIRMYPKKAYSNVQVSYKPKPAFAEFGKVPAAFRNSTYKEKTKEDFPQGKYIPKTLEEFLSKEKEYKKKILQIKSSNYFNLGVNSVDEAIENIISVYNSAPDTYIGIELNTKLQGLEIAYGLSKLSKEDLDSLLTEWSLLTQKKGDNFGPFVKVY